MAVRIFVTGGSGLVGQNFQEHTACSNHTIIAPTSSELDLLDYDAVVEWIGDANPEFIVHAAGKVGGIQANLKDPVGFLLENLEMGTNVVKAAKKLGIKKVLNLGSSCMYPRNAPNPLNESSVLQGELEPTNEGYALAKITVARLCEYISRENDSFEYKTLMPCNVYGRHDKFDPKHSHMVPAIIHKLHQAKIRGEGSVEIWGDGTARREFMYAGDLADCMWHCVNKFSNIPQLMNAGLGRDHTVNEYYHAAADVVGYTGTFCHDLSKPVGMKQKLVCTKKLFESGWQAKTALISGLEKTYQYYLQVNAQ